MTTFEIADIPVLGAECPAVPEGASNWERQEAGRMWREALDCYRQLIGRLVSDHEALVATEDNQSSFVGPCNDAALLAKAHEATGRLDGTLTGIRHRLALAARED